MSNRANTTRCHKNEIWDCQLHGSATHPWMPSVLLATEPLRHDLATAWQLWEQAGRLGMAAVATEAAHQDPRASILDLVDPEAYIATLDNVQLTKALFATQLRQGSIGDPVDPAAFPDAMPPGKFLLPETWHGRDRRGMNRGRNR